MTWALVLLLTATSAFTVLVVHRTRPGPAERPRPDLRRLLLAGAAVLGVLGLAAVATAVLTDRPDLADKLAVLGLLSYFVYLGALAVVARATSRR
ncbi:hypothetical protein GCM10009616_01760 [Microlunatus lacustris]